MPEFGEGRAIVQDGYIDLHLGPQFVVRSGKFKPPYSLERLQMAADVPFVERSIANNLVPIRDVGLMLMGGPGKGGLEWELGVFNGIVDNGSGDTNTGNSLDIAARLFYQPFASHPKAGIQGFGFGVAATSGRADEPLTGVVLRTAGRSPFFRYSDGTTADGNRTRFAPQFFFYAGALGLLGEYFTTQQRVRKDTAIETVTLNGLNLQATYVLTGEKTSFRNVAPRRPFDPTNGGGGAYEVALRYSHFHASNGAFQDGFADSAVSAEDADAYTVGLNWYLTRQVKAQLNYEHTQFAHALRFPTGLHKYEDAVVTNLQLQF